VSDLCAPRQAGHGGLGRARALQDDDRLGVHVRRLRTAFEHGDREEVRAKALGLLRGVPHDAAARDLLRRLRDVGA
jgi:hypothetical protein